jgi:DNA-binding NarL/FixJ family response regulator
MDIIKVLIVEDDLDWLKELVRFLYNEEDILIIGTATNKEEAVELAKTIQLDIVLMDINLSDNILDGIYATLEMTEICDAKVIMLTSLIDEEVIEKAFTAGAVNYIVKSKYKLIPHMIREAYSETTPVEILMKRYRNYKKEEQLRSLTPAETEVFNLVEQGYTRSQIEVKLYKTENTVKNQIKNILKKLGGSSVKEAIAKVEKRGLLNSNLSNNKQNTKHNREYKY